LNLVAAYCDNTNVSFDSYRNIIQVVRGEAQIGESDLNQNGFVYFGDFAEISQPDAHAFRLLYLNGWWHIHAAFFGGSIASFVKFPGPNNESWNCADIVAPLRSWFFKPSPIIQTLRFTITRKGKDCLDPTLKMRHYDSFFKAVRVMTKHPQIASA
jgi:hypothetical protein